MSKLKFLIISNPHGKGSSLIETGIELKRIKGFIEKKFGVKNKALYSYYLKKNEQYKDTGLIYMPLEYFKEWSSDVILILIA